MIKRKQKLLPFTLLNIFTTTITQNLNTFTFHLKQKPYTILNHIEDPKEKINFQQLLETTTPINKKNLTKIFLKQYPNS